MSAEDNQASTKESESSGQKLTTEETKAGKEKRIPSGDVCEYIVMEQKRGYDWRYISLPASSPCRLALFLIQGAKSHIDHGP